MICNVADFTGAFNIPGLADVNLISDNNSISNFFKEEIDTIESAALHIFFGREFASKFIDQLDTEDNNKIFKDGVEEKWTVLLNGKKEIHYKGIKKAIIAYVYYELLKEFNSRLTSTGVKEINSKTSKHVLPTAKYVNARNTWVDSIIGDYYNYRKPNIVNTKFGLSVQYATKNTSMSAYEFIESDEYDFSDVYLEKNPYEKIII